MQIQNLREQPPGSYALFIFDIYLPKAFMTLRNLKLCLSKKGTHFIGYPNFAGEELDPQGKKVWTPYYEFHEGKKKEFEDSVFEALKPSLRFQVNRFSK